MRLKSKSAQRKFLTFGLLFILLGILSFGTIAYFTDNEVATNVITAGNIDITLVEKKAISGEIYSVPFEEIIGVMPGEEYSKETFVINSGDYAAYVRVSVEVLFTLNNGIPISTTENPIEINYNTTNWTFKDGFYYYNTVLEPGEFTEPLFTTVTFVDKMDNSFSNSKGNVKVLAYATQVANNGNSVFDAEGWLLSEEE